MRNLVSQSKHLGGLTVGTVYENERSNRIYKCETTKLFRVQFAMGVVSDYTVNHDKNARCFRL